MNLKRFFLTLMAVSVAFASCKQEEELGMANLTVNPGELSFEQSEGSSEVEILATRDWLIASQPDWVAVSVPSGAASTKPQKVSVSVNANSGYNRTGTVVFTIGIMKAALTVNQKGAQGEIKLGTGTLEDPFTVAGVIKYVNELGSDVNSPNQVYVKGKVVAVSEEFSSSFGNGTFTISDDGAPGEVFTCYRVLYLGNRKWKSSDDQVKQGDDVIVHGNVVNFKGNTPETSQGTAYLYSLNGKTEGSGTGGDAGTPKGKGTMDDPYNPAGAAAYAKSLGNDVQSPVSIYIKGKISKVGTTFAASGDYGNATFNIEDASDGTGDFYVYQTYYLGNRKWKSGDTEVKEGDEVIICGPVINYKGNTPETVGKGASYIYSLNGVTEGGDPTPPGPGTGGGDYSSNVSMTKGTSCYDDNKLTVNGTDGVPNLKFGTSSKYGDGTVVLPAGTTEVSFYAIAWKGADASLKFSIGDSSMSFDVAANDGASGSGPYVVTVTDTDKYSFKFDSPLAADTSVKVETYAGNKKGYRAFLFGVQAK